MNCDALRELVLDTIRVAAPGVEPSALRVDAALRSQLELDSMDWLNVIAGLEERLRLQIPESDYGRLGSLDDIVAYLAARQAAARSA
jgi:acyl carrier protein